MMVLKCNEFYHENALTRFVNDYCIQKENIQAIVVEDDMFKLFYWTY